MLQAQEQYLSDCQKVQSKKHRSAVAYLKLSKDTWLTADEAGKVACVNL